MNNDDGTVEVDPVNVTIDLSNGLNITQPIAACPAGFMLTGFTINLCDSSVALSRAYGNGSPTRCFQGQCFDFGSYGDCIGVMTKGLCFGCAASPGLSLQVELYFAPALASITASQ